jgi:hypothetical protein
MNYRDTLEEPEKLFDTPECPKWIPIDFTTAERRRRAAMWFLHLGPFRIGLYEERKKVRTFIEPLCADETLSNREEALQWLREQILMYRDALNRAAGAL